MSHPLSPWAVLWDMDGVLIDSAEAHFRAWARLFQEQGVPYSREIFQRTFGQRNDTVLRDILGSDLDAERLRQLDERKEAYYREWIPDLVRPLPGAMELLQALYEAGVPQAVGSSAPRINLTTVLEALQIGHIFGATVSGEEVERGKPAPDTFLLAAHRLKVPPARCVVLEDAPAGIEAAHSAGMKCVAVTSTRNPSELAQADWVVARLTEVDVASLQRLVSAHRREKNSG